jgi:hypothetical protein
LGLTKVEDPKPHLIPGIRAFTFDHKPTLDEIHELRDRVQKEQGCPADKELRVFSVQFWAFYTPQDCKTLGIKDLDPSKTLGGGVTEIDPRTISINKGTPSGKIAFDFSLLYEWPDHPESTFWLHANHGRGNQGDGAVFKRSTLNGVQSQSFTCTVYCVVTGPPSKWYEPRVLPLGGDIPATGIKYLPVIPKQQGS